MEDYLDQSPIIDNMDDLFDYVDTFPITIIGILPWVSNRFIDINNELDSFVIPLTDVFNDLPIEDLESSLFISDTSIELLQSPLIVDTL